MAPWQPEPQSSSSPAAAEPLERTNFRALGKIDLSNAISYCRPNEGAMWSINTQAISNHTVSPPCFLCFTSITTP